MGSGYSTDSSVEYQLISGFYKRWHQQDYRHFCWEKEVDTTLAQLHHDAQEEVKGDALLVQTSKFIDVTTIKEVKIDQLNELKARFDANKSMLDLLDMLIKLQNSDFQYHGFDIRLEPMRSNLDFLETIPPKLLEDLVFHPYREKVMAENLLKITSNARGNMLVLAGLIHVYNLQLFLHEWAQIPGNRLVSICLMDSSLKTDKDKMLNSYKEKKAIYPLGIKFIDMHGKTIQEIFDDVQSVVEKFDSPSLTSTEVELQRASCLVLASDNGPYKRAYQEALSLLAKFEEAGALNEIKIYETEIQKVAEKTQAKWIQATRVVPSGIKYFTHHLTFKPEHTSSARKLHNFYHRMEHNTKLKPSATDPTAPTVEINLTCDYFRAHRQK